MRNEGLTKTYLADAAIVKHRIVKHGASDTTAAQATTTTEALLGVSDSLGADAAGDQVDIIMGGIANVEYGGNVSAGDPLTSDADGKAVASAPALTVTDQIIGFAMVDGVDGDIGSVHLVRGTNTNGADS